jgi:salicylate hydroxylase
MRRALIAGAGVAGLASALALAKSGLEAVIFERATALEEFGAGLQLSPNATRVLASFGALDAVLPLATAPRAIRILRGRDDAALCVLDLSNAATRWGAPYLVIHRADLQRALVELAGREPAIELRLGTELVGYGANADKVQATSSSAPTACARKCAKNSASGRTMRRPSPAASPSAPRWRRRPSTARQARRW